MAFFKDSENWRRKLMEVIAWVALIAFFWTLNAFVMIANYERQLLEFSMFRLVVNECSSGVGALVMVPLVLKWVKLYPLQKTGLVQFILGHTGGAVIFSIGHVTVMSLIREFVFYANGLIYNHSGRTLFDLYFFEIKKDIPVYCIFVLVIMIYGVYRKKQDGSDDTHMSSEKPGKILVKTNKGVLFLELGEIDWLQADANYIRVFSGGKEFLIRSTINQMEQKLKDNNFARVHRSHIVNLSKISEIKPIENGNYQIKLNNGSQIPLSRTYKDNLLNGLSV